MKGAQPNTPNFLGFLDFNAQNIASGESQENLSGLETRDGAEGGRRHAFIFH